MNHIAQTGHRDAADLTQDLIRLRRDGLPPLRFLGAIIARHDGYYPGATLWHDLGLYRTTSGDYVVEIVARQTRATSTGPTRCHAICQPTLDAALLVLETHDPAADLCPGLSAPALGDRSVPPVVLAQQAAALQATCHDVTRRYRMGVGAFLAGIAMRDNALRIQ